MKKISTIIFLFVLSFMLVGCNSVKVPDLIGIQESYAIEALTKNELLFQVISEYSDEVDVGKVTRTVPESNVSIEKNSKVTMYVSKGPKTIYSKSSYMSWGFVYGSTRDDWNFDNPIIDEGNLVVKMKPSLNSSYNITWDGYGYASLKEGANKSFPLTFTSVSDYYVLTVPLGDLDNVKISSIDFQLSYRIGTTQRVLSFNLIINW